MSLRKREEYRKALACSGLALWRETEARWILLRTSALALVVAAGCYGIGYIGGESATVVGRIGGTLLIEALLLASAWVFGLIQREDLIGFVKAWRAKFGREKFDA